MFSAPLQSGSMTPEDEQKLQRQSLQQFGKGLDQLTQSELDSLFAQYSGPQANYEDMVFGEGPQGTVVGSGIYVAPNAGEVFADAFKRVAGGYMLGKSREAERGARKTASQVQARRDELDRQREANEAAQAERERREWLAMILGRGA